jgi:hypothetical protein
MDFRLRHWGSIRNLWLSIGYCFLGYVTQQYDVQIPFDCVAFDVKWQTDPPRRQFLGLHVSWFVFPTLTFMSFGTVYKYAETDGGEQVAGTVSTPQTFKVIGFMIDAVLLVFSAITTFVAATFKEYDDILKLEHNCYASYASSPLGYLNFYIPD